MDILTASRSRYRADLGDRDGATRVYAGIGANIGDPVQTLKDAVQRIADYSGISVDSASSVYRNPPVGPQDQPHFYNAVLALSTTLCPQDLLKAFLQIEKAFGRVRDVRWGPRTLDLDILLYGELEIVEPGLTIPHPRMLERSFVLVPLLDLKPSILHPTANEHFEVLAGRVASRDLERIDVSLMPDHPEV